MSDYFSLNCSKASDKYKEKYLVQLKEHKEKGLNHLCFIHKNDELVDIDYCQD